MNNSDLWIKAEVGAFNKGDIFKNQSGDEIIFTGEGFLFYHSEKDSRYEDVMVLVEDRWEYAYNDSEELRKRTKERR